MLGKGSISQSLASKILRRFDFEIEAWKKRPIKKEVAILVLDAIPLKGSITGLRRAKPVLLPTVYTKMAKKCLILNPANMNH